MHTPRRYHAVPCTACCSLGRRIAANARRATLGRMCSWSSLAHSTSQTATRNGASARATTRARQVRWDSSGNTSRTRKSARKPGNACHAARASSVAVRPPRARGAGCRGVASRGGGAPGAGVDGGRRGRPVWIEHATHALARAASGRRRVAHGHVPSRRARACASRRARTASTAARGSDRPPRPGEAFSGSNGRSWKWRLLIG